MLSVIAAGVGLIGAAIFRLGESSADWPLFIVLIMLATLAHLFEAVGPNNEAWNANLVFYFTGALLLSPFFFGLLVLIPHLIQWIIVRARHSKSLRQWYIQPFNIATHLIAGFAARWVFALLQPLTGWLVPDLPLLASLAALIIYIWLNHFLVAAILVLARGHSWRQSGLFDWQNLLSDAALSCQGYVLAVLWHISPWLVLPVLAPLLMTYRVLKIPQLEQEARIDAKTGLTNARHFNQLFGQELERARRFDRPLAVIMTDLDLLRNVNNTYGHLAGDAVLARVGQLLRENVREYDIAARFGGEEFSIVLLEANIENARAFADRLRRTIEAAEFNIPTSLRPIHVTMSFGVACFPRDAATTTDLIHAADVAVYQAKLRGRNCVVCVADVLPSDKTDEQPPSDRSGSAYGAAFLSRTSAAPQSETPSPEEPTPPPAKPMAQTLKRSTPAPRKAHMLWFVMGVVGLAAFVLIAELTTQQLPIDWPGLVLLAAMAVIAEWLHIDVYGTSTVSVSVAINFAAALIAGVPGVVVVSLTIALIHYVQARPAFYQTVFNWATHALAGSLPALVIRLAQPSLNVDSGLIGVGLLTIVTGLGYYTIETGLIAAAIALDEQQRLRVVWGKHFKWLMTHYVVLCFMGTILAIAHTALGLAGVIVFALPPFMTRYAQRQYVERTQDSMHELQRMNTELTHANQEVTAATQVIRTLNDELFLMLAKIVDARDPFVAGHTTQVANYAVALAQEVELPTERVEQVRQAALLHDIGKIGISEQLLHKPARLTDEEYVSVQHHAVLGAELLETCLGLRHLAPFVRHHHEWWDGRGYPDHLLGEAIPLEARILAVCDAVEAMASDRPYSQAFTVGEITDELWRCAGTQFDPKIVEAFARIIEQRGEHFITNSAFEVAQQQAGTALQPDNLFMQRFRIMSAADA
jgi:diguanylate cyclase (GGDEF)-like protein/putative nucleotidyltransferase with HDIG domain